MSRNLEDFVLKDKILVTKSDYWEKNSMVFAVIADENTCVGFLLAGVGHAWPDGLRNVFVVERTTTDAELEKCLATFVTRGNVAIVVITQDVAARLEECLAVYNRPTPVVLIVPSPYDTNDEEDRESYDSTQRFGSETSSHVSGHH